MLTLQEYLTANPAAFTAGLVVFGLLVGSFLNVVIYRLPRMMEQEWQRECRVILDLPAGEAAAGQKEFNLAFPNSHCPQCGASIKPWHNIPVVSWLWLRGRCAECKARIPLRYPIIEAVAGIAAGVVAWEFGFGWLALATAVLSWALIALTVIDIDHQLLPDQITLPLLWLGLVVNSFELIVPIQDAVWGAIGGYMVLWLVYQTFKLVTGKEGMGFGDFKLLAALGAWLGWQSLPLIILLSSLVGAVIGSAVLVAAKRGRGTPIPFGPYLAIAGWIALIWGEEITRSYLQFAGLA